MVNINWTNEAEFWLKDIHDYIAQENPKIAKKVVTEIFTKTQILSTFPKVGYPYQNDTNNEVRILLYGHYRIAYLIKETRALIDKAEEIKEIRASSLWGFIHENLNEKEKKLFFQELLSLKFQTVE